MTEQLPDTIRHLYTDPAEFIDSDHPAVQDFAKAAAPANAGEREIASLLYKTVRDGIRYNPYVNMARDYANLLGEDLTSHDIEREAAEG
jgi:transglutaminase-like putative cysteine protease